MNIFDVLPYFYEAPWSYIVVPVILVTSIAAFYHKPLFHALLLHPYEVYIGKRIHTLLTSAFVHRNWLHLLMNLIVVYILVYDLFSIGVQEYGQNQSYLLTPFVICFLILFPNLLQVWKQKNNFSFTSTGASGLSFGLYGFSCLIYPQEKAEHLFFPFLNNSAKYWLYIFIIILLLSFAKKSIINRTAHLSGYLFGSVVALFYRKDALYELIHLLF